MLRFTLKVVNAKDLDIAFTGLVAQIKDWTPLWPKVINQICKAEARAFSTEGQLTAHGQWAPLTKEYAERKGKKYGSRLIENASGRLRAALTGHTADTIEESAPLRMRWGTSLPYAYWQQTGFHISHGGRYGKLGSHINRMFGVKAREKGADWEETVPARRVIDFTEEDRQIIQRQMQREALNFARRLGFKIASEAGFRDVTVSEARQMGVTALAGGPGYEWVGAV